MTVPGLRGRTLLAVFGVSAVALVVATALISIALRDQLLRAIERNLLAETRLAAALVTERETDGSVAALDRGPIGSVVDLSASHLRGGRWPRGWRLGRRSPRAGLLDNHGSRPEVIAARRGGRRHRAPAQCHGEHRPALCRDHRGSPHVAVVRLALPLTDVGRPGGGRRRSLLLALAVALACALALAWISSMLLARRMKSIAGVARRYASGDFSEPTRDYGTDELGTVARVLDETTRQLGGRMSELAEDRARMEAMLAGMLEGVLVIDPEGRVLLANDAVAKLLRVETIRPGQSYGDVLGHPDIGGMLGQALDGHTPDALEFSPPRDPARTVFARAAPITTARSRGAVLVLHDITDLRRADRMRRDFVANVSHELRTPLTAIQGYVEALLDEDEPEPEEADRFLEIIARHANRMERLVRDLLRLARIEGGQEPVEKAPTAVSSIFADVVTELAPAIEDKQQRMVTHAEAGTAMLMTDAAKLHDAVRNLVENAAAYAPAGTRIELAARVEAARVEITVADEGPGIPDTDLSRIFERFYRVDKARSRESGGTGLGLSIVKHLIEVLGGEVRAANRPTGGAVFTITLPLG